MTTAREGALTLWGAGLVALGALSLAGAWQAWQPAVALAAAAVLPLVLLRAVVGLGVSRWATTTALSLLLVLAAYLLSAGAGTTLTTTLRDAVPLLLSEPRPYVLRADLLVAPLLLTGLVSLLAGLRLDGRTRAVPLVGAVVLYAAGALLTAGEGDPWGLLAGLLLLLGLTGWVLLDGHPGPTRRRLAVTAPLAGLLAAGVATLALVPAAAPYDPRALVEPPLVEVGAASPLPRLGAWSANPDVELFRVSGDPVPLRLVSLDDYDGVQWRAATRYAALGTPDDSPLPAGARQRSATVAVSLEALGGDWLPTPGRPVAVSDPDALVDPRTGTLLHPQVPRDATYEVSGTVDAPDLAELVGASVPSGPRVERYLRQPDLPYAFSVYLTRVLGTAATPYERALAIEAAVRNDRELSASAISGSALWRVEAFLFGEPGRSGARSGTSEQFATAFALLARAGGLPTRLVVGFRPGAEQPDGSRVVRGSDALAWPEVYFDRLGWVPFSPTPDDTTFTRGRPEVAPAPPVDAGALPGPGEPASDGQAGRTATATASAPVTGPSAVGRLAPAGALLLVLAWLRLARAARSARHRRLGAAGGWAEVLDALRLAGRPAAPHRWAGDVGAEVDRDLGTAVARQIADLAERDAFGPVGTRSAYPAAEVRAVRRAARRVVPLWRRWWWAFDPRALRRQRVTH